MNHLSLDPKLEWMLPFLEAANREYPELISRLRAVKARKPVLSRSMPYYALCTQETNKWYSITLMTHGHYTQTKEYKKDGRAEVTRSYVDFSKIDLLHNLAHEIAHLEYWEHSPARLILECEITTLFMELLEGFGYVSEEAELADKKQREDRLGKNQRA